MHFCLCVSSLLRSPPPPPPPHPHQVVYARKDLGADVILDMATLTGAQGISTGRYHGGVLTNSEDWEGLAVQAGKNSGDLVVCVLIIRAAAC